MAFDPVQPALTGGLITALYYVVRIIEARVKRLKPGTVEYMEEQFRRINEKIDGLAASNAHRKREISDLEWKVKRLESTSDS